MRNIFIPLLSMIVIVTSSASAKVCDIFLTNTLSSTTHMTFENNIIDYFEIENAGLRHASGKLKGQFVDRVVQSLSYLADKEFVTAMVVGLRLNPDFFENFSVEQMAMINQVFFRYEHAEYNKDDRSKGGRPLTEVEQLTFAVFEFSNVDRISLAELLKNRSTLNKDDEKELNDMLKQVDQAIRRIKRIRPAVRFRHPDRILLPLLNFLQESGRQVEADRVRNLLYKTDRTSTPQ